MPRDSNIADHSEPREMLNANTTVRGCVPRLGEDRVLSVDIRKFAEKIQDGRFDEWAQ